MEINGLANDIANYQGNYNTSHKPKVEEAVSVTGGQTEQTTSAQANKVSTQESDTSSQDKNDKEKQMQMEAIESATAKLKEANKSFEFAVHEDTKRIMVKVIDKDTDEIIREIPSEKVLDMVAKMWELNGLLVDEKR